jgi:hypothetical protein
MKKRPGPNKNKRAVKPFKKNQEYWNLQSICSININEIWAMKYS